MIPHILSVDLKKDPNPQRCLFSFKLSILWIKTIKEFNLITKKDAVRRCSSEGYYCDKISIEKLKHFVSKEDSILMVLVKIVESF